MGREKNLKISEGKSRKRAKTEGKKKKTKKNGQPMEETYIVKRKKNQNKKREQKKKNFFFSKAFKFVLRDSKISESVTRGDDYAVFFFFPRVLPPRHLIAYLIYLFTYLFIRSIYSRTMRELLFS